MGADKLAMTPSSPACLTLRWKEMFGCDKNWTIVHLNFPRQLVIWFYIWSEFTAS